MIHTRQLLPNQANMSDLISQVGIGFTNDSQDMFVLTLIPATASTSFDSIEKCHPPLSVSKNCTSKTLGQYKNLRNEMIGSMYFTQQNST